MVTARALEIFKKEGEDPGNLGRSLLLPQQVRWSAEFSGGPNSLTLIMNHFFNSDRGVCSGTLLMHQRRKTVQGFVRWILW